MAVSSTAATFSWSSSSLFHSFGGSSNETAKFPDNRAVMQVLAQKKTKKTRKVKPYMF